MTTDLNNLPIKCYDDAIEILKNLKKKKPKATNLILLFNDIDKVFLNSKEYFELSFFDGYWFGFSIDKDGDDFFVYLNEVEFEVKGFKADAECAYKLHQLSKKTNTEFGNLLFNTDMNYFDNPHEYYQDLIRIAVDFFRPLDSEEFKHSILTY